MDRIESPTRLGLVQPTCAQLACSRRLHGLTSCVVAFSGRTTHTMAARARQRLLTDLQELQASALTGLDAEPLEANLFECTLQCPAPRIAPLPPPPLRVDRRTG